MTKGVRKLRCAVYTRKSSREGLEEEFDVLHAQWSGSGKARIWAWRITGKEGRLCVKEHPHRMPVVGQV